MALKVHHLRPAPGAKTPKTRKGRGEASKGKTSGRGTKGTRARNKVPAAFEGGQMPLHMRVPKLKGFTNPNTVTFQVSMLLPCKSCSRRVGRSPWLISSPPGPSARANR